MIHSDWGDWLPRAVADADPDGVATWYLGCNGFVLKGSGGTTLFVDPYLGLGKPPRTVRMIPVPFAPEDVVEADAVLVTHEHSDHVHGASQAPILADTGADFHAPGATIDHVREEAWTDEWDVDADQFHGVAVGDTVEVGEFTVHVEPAHDPDAVDPVSYAVEHDAGTFFHGGDTKPTEAFGGIADRRDVDLGALASGSVGPIADKETGERRRTRWYNDENEIVEAANALRIDRLVPTHWDMWRHLTADPKVLHEHLAGFAYPRRLEIARIGDRIDLPA